MDCIGTRFPQALVRVLNLAKAEVEKQLHRFVQDVGGSGSTAAEKNSELVPQLDEVQELAGWACLRLGPHSVPDNDARWIQKGLISRYTGVASVAISQRKAKLGSDSSEQAKRLRRLGAILDIGCALLDIPADDATGTTGEPQVKPTTAEQVTQSMESDFEPFIFLTAPVSTVQQFKKIIVGDNSGGGDSNAFANAQFSIIPYFSGREGDIDDAEGETEHGVTISTPTALEGGAESLQSSHDTSDSTEDLSNVVSGALTSGTEPVASGSDDVMDNVISSVLGGGWVDGEELYNIKLGESQPHDAVQGAQGAKRTNAGNENKELLPLDELSRGFEEVVMAAEELEVAQVATNDKSVPSEAEDQSAMAVPVLDVRQAGDKLYPVVLQYLQNQKQYQEENDREVSADAAGKVTGMLLEGISLEVISSLLNKPTELDMTIAQAVEALERSSRAQKPNAASMGGGDGQDGSNNKRLLGRGVLGLNKKALAQASAAAQKSAAITASATKASTSGTANANGHGAELPRPQFENETPIGARGLGDTKLRRRMKGVVHSKSATDHRPVLVLDAPNICMYVNRGAEQPDDVGILLLWRWLTLCTGGCHVWYLLLYRYQYS